MAQDKESIEALLSVQTEYPAALEISALSPEGYPMTLTLRDKDTTLLLERAEKALSWLREKGYTPPGFKQKPKRGEQLRLVDTKERYNYE